MNLTMIDMEDKLYVYHITKVIFSQEWFAVVMFQNKSCASIYYKNGNKIFNKDGIEIPMISINITDSTDEVSSVSPVKELNRRN